MIDPEALRREADILDAIKAEFPDLREQRTQWSTRLVAAGVGMSPDLKLHTYHLCGCCEDATLVAAFYVERHGKHVYADPLETYIGEKRPVHFPEDDGEGWWGSRDELDEGWRDRVAKVSDEAVRLVEQFAATLAAPTPEGE